MNLRRSVFHILIQIGACHATSEAAISQTTNDSCGEFERVDIKLIDERIVTAIREKVRGDIEFDVSRQVCDDVAFIAFVANGKYRNPGYSWMVKVSRKTGEFEILAGM